MGEFISYIMRHFMLYKRILQCKKGKQFFFIEWQKGCYFLSEGQEMCNFLNRTTDKVQPPPETVWVKLWAWNLQACRIAFFISDFILSYYNWMLSHDDFSCPNACLRSFFMTIPFLYRKKKAMLVNFTVLG